MTSSNPDAELAHQQLVTQLISRWPESHPAPSLGRIRALLDLLGSPERSAPVIQIAGTNGKGSTATMIESLLSSLGLRTGRYASPHLMDVVERICVDGQPISHEQFDEAYRQIEPFVRMVDDQLIDGVKMTFFEVMTALAYAVFADAPVDVMVIEVGLGGTWDATNVVDADVAVICPIDMDHMHLLGDTIDQIAANKAGIIKAGATAVIAGQRPEAAGVLMQRCKEVGARPLLEGADFALLGRRGAVGGQVVRIDAAGGPVGELYVPLFGAHMARNAALAVAAVEAFLGGRALDPKIIDEGFSQVVAPARTEVVHRSPTILLDTAHNPHGVRATLDTVAEAFGFSPMIGLVSMLADKQVDEVLGMLAEHMSHVVVTSASTTSRAMSTTELAELAEGVFGPGRVTVAEGMEQAIDQVIRLADEAGPAAGVLIIGSVIGAGEARQILVARGDVPESQWVTGGVVTPSQEQADELADNAPGVSDAFADAFALLEGEE